MDKPQCLSRCAQRGTAHHHPVVGPEKERHHSQWTSFEVRVETDGTTPPRTTASLPANTADEARRKPPNTLPLVGNGLYFLQAREKLFAWFTRCERLFGPETFELYVPSLPPGVVINDPRNVDFVFHNEGIFARGAFMKAPLWDLFGHGIINSDGELWRVQRRAGLGFLSNRNLQVLTDVALPRYLAQSIEALRAASGRGREADLQTVFLEITSQLMGKMAYNVGFSALPD